MTATEASRPVRLATVPRVERVAAITVHTSPLTALGGSDAGGMTVYILALAEQLAATGVCVDIFTRRTDTETPDIVEIAPGVRVITIAAGPPEPMPKDELFCYLADFASEMALYSLRAGVRYDVIHTHYWLSGWVGHLLKRYWQAPTVHMFHTLAHLKNLVSLPGEQEAPLRLRVERELISLLDQIVAPNPDERAELIWRLGAKESRICTIPPGIDLDRFHPREAAGARQDLGLPENPLVLYVGRIDPIKDLTTLLDAFQIARKSATSQLPPKLLVIGGELQQTPDGPTPTGGLARLEQQIADMGMAEDVILLGGQPQQILPKYYAASTVCVVPSLYESFGLVAVEAMACGLPVVATRVGGLKFTVEEGISGLLVPPRAPEKMAEAICSIIEDRDLRASYQVGARQAAIRFSWHTIGSAILNLYERLAEGDSDNLCCYGDIYAS